MQWLHWVASWPRPDARRCARWRWGGARRTRCRCWRRCGTLFPQRIEGDQTLGACQVALGRCALDPLPVLASLCGPSAEILAMALHPLKDLLPRQELAAAAERVCCTAACQVRLLYIHVYIILYVV